MVACIPVSPVEPTVTQASCVDGVVTVPTVVLATGPTGVSYVVDPAGPYDAHGAHTVTVTATLADGYAWGQLTPGWLPAGRMRRRQATFTVDLARRVVCRGDAGGADGGRGDVSGWGVGAADVDVADD